MSFQVKIRILAKYIHYHKPDSLPTLEEFPDEIGDDINECNTHICTSYVNILCTSHVNKIMKWANIWKIYISQLVNIFQMTKHYGIKSYTSERCITSIR